MRSVDSATAAESVAQGTFILAQSRNQPRRGMFILAHSPYQPRRGMFILEHSPYQPRRGTFILAQSPYQPRRGAFALAKNESAAAPRHLCSFSLIMPTPCIAQRTRRPITAAAYTMSDTPVHSTSRPNEPRLVAAAGTK